VGNGVGNAKPGTGVGGGGDGADARRRAVWKVKPHKTLCFCFHCLQPDLNPCQTQFSQPNKGLRHVLLTIVMMFFKLSNQLLMASPIFPKKV